MGIERAVSASARDALRQAGALSVEDGTTWWATNSEQIQQELERAEDSLRARSQAADASG